MSAPQESQPSRTTSSGLAPLLLIFLGLFVGLWLLPKADSHKEGTSDAYMGKDHLFLIELVRSHPDNRVSRDLYSRWEKGEIAIATESMTVGEAGGFLRPLPGEIPTILLSETKVKAAQSDELIARSLQKTIRHEFGHYLQWKSGQFFQVQHSGQDLVQECTEIWSREYPLYLEDCFLAEKWWPGQPSIFLPGRCDFKDDPLKFAQMLYGLLPAPECQPIWAQIIQNMEM